MKKIILLSFLMLFAFSAYAAENNEKIVYNGKTISAVDHINYTVTNTPEGLTQFLKVNFVEKYNLGKEIAPVYFSKFGDSKSSVYAFDYTYKGIPVEGGRTSVLVKDGKVIRINNTLGKIEFDKNSLISDKLATEKAFVKFSDKKVETLPKHTSELVVIKMMGKFIPAYKVRFQPVSLLDGRVVYINAINGSYLYTSNKIIY